MGCYGVTGLPDVLNEFCDGKIAVKLNDDENELDALADFLLQNGFKGFEGRGVRNYIYQCVGPRDWTHICIGDEMEIQGCRDGYVEEIKDKGGMEMSIMGFISGNISRSEDTPPDVFDDILGV